MKIFWSFNTKLDEQELFETIQQSGQWNAIMMKKHRIFLVRPMIWMLFAFMAFGLLIRFAYRQFYSSKYERIFRFLVVAYSLVTCIWCVHSIIMILHDINLQMVNKKWYIDVIEAKDLEDWRYEKFLRHTLISMELQVVLMILNVIASFAIDTSTTASNIALNIVWVIVNIWFLFLLYKVLDRIIDYEMDFNIFSINQFKLYRQHWFFRIESMNIATSTVKIVQDSKSGFLWALFNFWKISIHPEWNLWESENAIELFYVSQPQKLTKKLNEFIEKSKESRSIKTVS